MLLEHPAPVGAAPPEDRSDSNPLLRPTTASPEFKPPNRRIAIDPTTLPLNCALKRFRRQTYRSDGQM